MSAYNKAILYTVLVMFIWGSSFTVTKLVVADLPPFWFAFLRHAVASVILLGMLFFRKKQPAGADRPPIGSLLWLGLTGVTIYYLFLNLSMRYTSASTGALLQGFIPVVIAVMAAVFLKEALNKKQVAGILISVAGVFVIGFLQPPSTGEKDPLFGNLLVIGCIIAWSVYTILSKKVAGYDPTLVTAYITVSGTLFLIPAVIAESFYHPLTMPSLQNWLSILYLGMFASAFAYVLYNHSLQFLSAAQVGTFLNLDPVIGAVIAIIFLHEKISWLQVGGCLLVVIGIWLNSARKPDADSGTVTPSPE